MNITGKSVIPRDAVEDFHFENLTGSNNTTTHDGFQPNSSHTLMMLLLTSHDDVYDTIEAAYGFAGSAIAVVGVVLNIMSAIVWNSPEMRSTTAR